MKPSQPIVMIPGLFCTARLFEKQLSSVWPYGQVTVADHRRHNSLAEIAHSILENAPPIFALVGLSMGGYISFEILRRAPERVAKLALLNTTARADTIEQTKMRKDQIERARKGEYETICLSALPMLFHRHEDAFQKTLMQMSEETGPEAFIRQQEAIMDRVDSRPLLASIRCQTLVLVGCEDRLTPPERSQEIAAGISGSQYVEIQNCGHVSTIEQPQLTTNALVQWLER